MAQKRSWATSSESLLTHPSWLCACKHVQNILIKPAYTALLFVLFNFHYFISGVGKHTQAMALLWRSGTIMQKLVLSFRCLGSGDQIQIIRMVASSFTH